MAHELNAPANIITALAIHYDMGSHRADSPRTLELLDTIWMEAHKAALQVHYINVGEPRTSVELNALYADRWRFLGGRACQVRPCPCGYADLFMDHNSFCDRCAAADRARSTGGAD